MVVVVVVVWKITSRPGTVYASLGARLRRLPGHGQYEVPLNITSSIGTNEGTVDAGLKTLSTSGNGGAKNCCDKVMCVGAVLCALLLREFFSARGAACDSARCRVRCCFCAR